MLSLGSSSYGQAIDLRNYFNNLEELEVPLLQQHPQILCMERGDTCASSRSINGTSRQDLVINLGI